MPFSLPLIPVCCFLNPRADPGLDYGDARRSILSHAGYRRTRAVISAWPGYAPTPLRELPAVAAACGLGRVYYKDEAPRFGLNSFKALGGAYAVYRVLERFVRERTGEDHVGVAELLSGRYRELTAAVTVTCATDGNHGRSVAWGARLFGCRCVIYIHATVSEGRRAAIAEYGAQVVRTPGNYDASIRRAAADAERYGRQVISDTSYPGYMDVPRDVMQGYTVMIQEALEVLPEPPSHVLAQGGVGGLAAAVCGHLWERYGPDRPRFLVVEPDRADCIHRSLERGEPVAVTGELDTLMAGLACGEVSLLAWEILREGVDAALTIPDQAAVDGMRLLAAGGPGQPPIVAGESAVAGLAGLIGVCADPGLRRTLGLDGTSRVLLFGSEGDTDPQLYRELVGWDAARVRGGLWAG